MQSEPVIAPSAYRHGYDDADMLHAYRNAFRMYSMDEGMTMYIGATESAELLEVGTMLAEDGATVIVHAMAARPKFLK